MLKFIATFAAKLRNIRTIMNYKLILSTLALSLSALPLMAETDDATTPSGTPELSRKLTDYASTPKFGGYFIGKYDYSDREGQSTNGGFSQREGQPTNGGFSQRLIRLYVDGTILNDFKYRIQLQTTNDAFHVKDVFVEWQKYKEAMVKIGQFKRAFTFENPYNPWDVGTGDYSQAVKKMAGFGDVSGEPSSCGGRDQGIQVQGDLLPSSTDGHRYIHYQLALYNGQGINTSDTDKRKDLIGTVQFQPIKDLYIGVFGWTGSYTANQVTVDRNRYAISAKYEHDGWSARAEYIHSQGHNTAKYNAIKNTFADAGKADGWYATVGVPVTPWLKVYGKYDVYRDDATWATAKTIYSLAPNFQIHKNLMLQLQFLHTHDRIGTDKDYNEIWAQTYVRF